MPPLSVALSLAAVTATWVWHRKWEEAGEGTPRRGVFDVLCHAGTALAVAAPALPYVRDRGGFLRLALASALLIDLDHVAAARSLRLRRCMTMDQRPPSHSLLAPVLLAVAAERLRPARHHHLGALLGLGSHLLRDLGTGGAPIVHPRRVVEVPYPGVLPLLGGLALAGRVLARRPARRWSLALVRDVVAGWRGRPR